MTTQTYANHARLVPLYHFVLSGLLLLTLIGSIVNLFLSIGDHHHLYNAALILVLTVCACLLFAFCRTFPLKAQDRAIRAEENLRHFVLTGKLLDSRLKIGQVIALRFAPDEEFVELASKAAYAGTPPDAIKRAIRNWRADDYRV
jgi:Family of unknown function (DUF6526)